ncbi:MAG: GNAT family N-acetyltransferase [Chloroflexota bacterium]
MNEILTPRLQLFPLTMAHLQLALRGQELLAAALAFPIVADMAYPAVHRAMQTKVQKMAQADMATHAWYTYWLMVLKANPVAIGMIGFKGAPNVHGEVEIGYGVAPEYERQGYTTEAAQALVAWGLAQPTCHAVIAATYKDNVASQRVLQKIGMTLAQEEETEFIWRITG